MLPDCDKLCARFIHAKGPIIMSKPIRIAILGYGNLGRGVELAVRANEDMKLVAFFTRRDPCLPHGSTVGEEG